MEDMESKETDWVIEGCKDPLRQLEAGRVDLLFYKEGEMWWSIWKQFIREGVERFPQKTDIHGRTLEYCVHLLQGSIKIGVTIPNSIEAILIRNLNTGETIPAALFA